MSFTPRNVSQLLVGTTPMATVAAYKAASATGDFVITKLADPNTASGKLANIGASIIVRTDGGDKVSEIVKGANITSIVEKVLVAGTPKNVTVTYQAPADFINKTFTCTIDVHDNIGSMLNDRFISAYVSTDGDGKFLKSDGTQVTATLITVGAEIAALLQSTVTQSRDNYTVTADGAGVITITETPAAHQVGVKDGINQPFVVIAGMKEGNVSEQALNHVPAVQVVTEGKIDDLVQIKNMEWFNSGYDKDPYRETGYPYSFKADSNIVSAEVSIGDAITIVQFYKDRDATNVERQHRQIIIVGAAATAFKTAIEEVTV